MQKYLLTSLKITNDTTCYLYPQYEYGEDGKSIHQIRKSDFPDRGTIYMSKLPDENLNKYLCKLFKISFETENIASQYNEYDMYSNKCKYYAKTSDIEELSRNELVEIISIEHSLDDILKDKSKRIISLPFLPLNKKILIKIGRWCYGPFTYSVEKTEMEIDCQIKIIPEEYKIDKYDYEELEKYVFEAQVTSNREDPKKFFIRDCEVLENEVRVSDTIEFIDNEVLIQECIDIITEGAAISDINQNGKSTLKNIIELLQKFPDLSRKHEVLSEKNIQRLSELLDDVRELEIYKDRIIEEYYSSDRITQEEKVKYLEEHPELIENAIKQSDEYKVQIAAFEGQKKSLEEELQGLIEKKESVRIELEAVKNDKEKYIDEVLKGVKDEIATLNTEKENLENKSKLIKEQNELADEQKKKLMREINELNIDIKAKVLKWLESKHDDDVIGLLVSEFGNYKVPANLEEDFNYNIVSYNSAEDIIERVSSYFTMSKRDIKRNDIINYLILIASNFITVFGGNPGTGKTSTCNILAKAFGIEKERYADISVGRGWNSSRDLVGYYNPLTHCIEKTQPKFSKCLETMKLESETSLSDALYLVLLDEANLSPIEHYWSEFNRISDDYDGKIIELCENTKYTISKELRFVATINYDHTTEILSPRFLDRAWIVMLDEIDSIDLLGGSIDDQNISNAKDMISFSSLVTHFSIGGEDLKNNKISPLAKDILNAFIEEYRNIGHAISPRSLSGMVNYCIVGEMYMKDEKQNAVDYAIAQKLLPIIDGNGSRYLEFLENIQKLCQEQRLSKSEKIISKIIKNGKQEHNYFNYFNL
ncbi:MAG: hypothetical protein KH359_05815 [Clostridiales bacterium]|nr:hypothetical protein [Clostridiales bacterium]